MKEKIIKLGNQIKGNLLNILPYILGPISLSKEKRISIELNQKEISICNLQSKKKEITKLINEKFEFAKSGITFEKDYQLYVDKISEIVKREKIEKKEVNLLVPTSEVTLKTINMPLMSDDELSDQLRTSDFWSQFTDLPAEGIEEMLDGLTLSYQILSVDKKENMMEILFTYIDSKKNEIKNQILKSSGLNPTVFEPKCLAITNLIMLTQKMKKNDEFLFLVYGDTENYLIHRTNNKFTLTENKLTRADITLLKQLEKMPDGSGPFWDELYDRFLSNIKPTIDEIIENPENKIKDLFIFSEIDENKNFIKGIQNKFENLQLINISIPPSVLNDELAINKLKRNKKINIKKEKSKLVKTNQSFFDNKVIKLNKNLNELLEKNSKNNNLAFSIGAALRYLNPYGAAEPLNCNYKINLHSKNNIIKKNKKILIENYFLQVSTYFLLVLFGGILAFKTPVYFKNQTTISEYTKIIKAHDSLYAEIANVSAMKKKIEKDKKMAAIILSKKDEYLDLVAQTIQLVPEGVMLDSIDYIKGKHVMFEGKAASDLDINLFLINLREQMGKPELDNLGRVIVPVNSMINSQNNKQDQKDINIYAGNESDNEIPSTELKTFKIKLNL
mgnify:CR=1 FL=1